MASQKEATDSVEITSLDLAIYDLPGAESDAHRSSPHPCPRDTTRRSRAEDKNRSKQCRSSTQKKTRRHKTYHNKQSSSGIGDDRDSITCLPDNVSSISERKDSGLAMTEEAGEVRGERDMSQSADNAGFEAGDEGTNWQQTFHTTVAIFCNNGIDEGEGSIDTHNANNQLMDDKTEVEVYKRSKCYDRNMNEHNGESIPSITSATHLEVGSNHTHAKQAFQKDIESDTDVGFKCSVDGGRVTRNMTKKSGNIIGCCKVEKQQEPGNCEAIQPRFNEYVKLPTGPQLTDRKAECHKAITCYSRIEACTCGIEACLSAIRITSLSHASQYFAVTNAYRLPVNAITLSSFGLIKDYPNNTMEYPVYPEQESLFGYESHLTGGVMVNGHILVSNISVMLKDSLRGDKASRSHNYSGFGSLRSKSGLEHFHDTHNEATFASFRENRHVNYAQSSYRAEIVGASNLAGVFSESDAAHKPLDHKSSPLIKNDGPVQDQKPFAGTPSATSIRLFILLYRPSAT